MQLNPESQKNNFLLISYKLTDISTYILMSLRRKPVPFALVCLKDAIQSSRGEDILKTDGKL